MPSLLDCLSDCQPKVRSDLMSFLNITSNELAQEMALLREVGLNIQEENEIYQLMPEIRQRIYRRRFSRSLCGKQAIRKSSCRRILFRITGYGKIDRGI